MLRYDIDKFKDAEGLTWTKLFDLRRGRRPEPRGDRDPGAQLDPKRFEPKKTRWAISNAKNRVGCRISSRRIPKASGASSRPMSTGVTAALAANNALDFDDLLLPVQLLQQNEQVRSYWHRRCAMCWWMNTRTPTAPSTA